MKAIDIDDMSEILGNVIDDMPTITGSIGGMGFLGDWVLIDLTKKEILGRLEIMFDKLRQKKNESTKEKKGT